MLLLCDMQEKFRPTIFHFTNVVNNAARLLQVLRPNSARFHFRVTSRPACEAMRHLYLYHTLQTKALPPLTLQWDRSRLSQTALP